MIKVNPMESEVGTKLKGPFTFSYECCGGMGSEVVKLLDSDP